MANVFETFASRSVGNSLTAVGSHTVAGGTTETVIGLTVSNITGSAVNVTVAYNDDQTIHASLKMHQYQLVALSHRSEGIKRSSLQSATRLRCHLTQLRRLTQ